MGVELPAQYQDDGAALAALGAAYRDAQQLRSLEPVAREYQQYQGQFQAWRQQQAQADADRQRQAQQWFKAPEFDASWESKLTRDPTTGEIRVVAGAPPDTAQKYLAWVEHQRSFMQKLAQDPIGAMKPGLEQLIRDEAQKIVQQHLGGYQERVSATDFVSQNSGWLHARDAQGNVQIDQRTGRPALSDLGSRFAVFVQEAAQQGMSQDFQVKYARASLQAELAMGRLQQQQGTQAAVSGGDAAKAAFLQQQAGGRGPAIPAAASVTPAVVTPAASVPLRTKRDLENRMLQQMQAAGIMPGQQIEM